MSATASPSELGAPDRVPGGLRGHGRIRLEAVALEGRTVRGRTEEAGPSRVRFPRSGRRGGALEAVLLNTGGGIAGGDSAFARVRAGRGTRLVVTTQAAEKVYRSDGASARLGVELAVEAGACLEWMPQATILFDGARVERSITAEVDPSARLLLVEPLVLGRTACGERLTRGRLIDQWRLRRGGRLVYADGLVLEDDVAAVLARRATLAGAAAVATVLLVAADAEARIEAVRDRLDAIADVEAGASAWDGMLAIRLLAGEGAIVERALRALIDPLGVAEPPRIWHS
ncbi:urease accessory protein UreD [Ancylobacter terrae]|uniref:urease accessory protein UreD n=1 Tax=Ancylobacter sp. sgz301288 TaxID=3342077 RepID=UPI0038591669